MQTEINENGQSNPRLASFLLALALGLVGCGLGDVATTPFPTRIQLPEGRISLPDHEPCRGAIGVPCVEVGHAVFGMLRESEGCVWYVLDNGTEVRIIWPFGYSAQFDPFIVFDNAGRAVAKDGDSLRAEGDGPLDGAVDACGRSRYVVLADPISAQPAAAAPS